MQGRESECKRRRYRKNISSDFVSTTERKVCELSKYDFESRHKRREYQQGAANPDGNARSRFRFLKKSI
jgi:hypothetical protein